ncbi:hypothetical protein HK097_000077 [Rhizophlyctis rosea]|uniref:Uncharacterized protein n=1 Tax=Rhizophlyctis rosea TaxID=64517 RepID=A0AAD5SKQ1_9FUNG|nr:hypothetical protein HK097_000077 [Rhizophlyctis rosea]
MFRPFAHDVTQGLVLTTEDHTAGIPNARTSPRADEEEHPVTDSSLGKRARDPDEPAPPATKKQKRGKRGSIRTDVPETHAQPPISMSEPKKRAIKLHHFNDKLKDIRKVLNEPGGSMRDGRRPAGQSNLRPERYIDKYCFALINNFDNDVARDVDRESDFGFTERDLRRMAAKMLNLVKQSMHQTGHPPNHTAAVVCLLAWEAMTEMKASVELQQKYEQEAGMHHSTYRTRHAEIVELLIKFADAIKFSKKELNRMTISLRLKELLEKSGMDSELESAEEEEEREVMAADRRGSQAERATGMAITRKRGRGIDDEPIETSLVQKPPSRFNGPLPPAHFLEPKPATIPDTDLIATLLPKPILAQKPANALAAGAAAIGPIMKKYAEETLVRTDLWNVTLSKVDGGKRTLEEPSKEEPATKRPRRKRNPVKSVQPPEERFPSHTYGPPAFLRSRQLDKNMEERYELARDRVHNLQNYLTFELPPTAEDLEGMSAADWELLDPANMRDRFDEIFERLIMEGKQKWEVLELTWGKDRGYKGVLGRKPWVPTPQQREVAHAVEEGGKGLPESDEAVDAYVRDQIAKIQELLRLPPESLEGIGEAAREARAGLPGMMRRPSVKEALDKSALRKRIGRMSWLTGASQDGSNTITTATKSLVK